MDAFDAEQRSQWKLDIISVGLIKGQVWKTLPFTAMGKCVDSFSSCSTPRSAMHLHHNRHHCIDYAAHNTQQPSITLFDTGVLCCLLIIGFMWTVKLILAGVHKLYHRDSTTKYYSSLILRGKQLKALQ
jgi:hypothetical protein